MSSVVSSTLSPSLYGATSAETPPQVASSTPSAGIGATTAAPALYQSFGTAFGTGLFGLRAPSNPEDAAIILAEISLAVDAAAREGSDNKFKGVLGGLRSGFGAAIAVFAASAEAIATKTIAKGAVQSELDTATGRQTQLTTQKSNLEGQIGQLNAEIASKTDQKTAAEGEKTTLLGQKQTLTNSIATLDGQISELDRDIAVARAGNDARVAELTATRNTAVGSRDTQRATLTDVNGQIADKTAEIDDLSLEITADRASLATATASLATVEASLVTVAATIATAQATIATLDAEIAALGAAARNVGLAVVAVFSELAVALQTGGGDRIASETRSTEFDRLLDDVTQTLKTFQQSQIEDALDQARTTGEANTQVDERRVQQLALGLVAGLADLLRTLASLGAPSSASRGEAAEFEQPYRLAV